MNRFMMMWRMAKRGRLIVMIAVSMAILLAFGLSVTAYGSQNSGQSNPGGYVKYTLDLISNTLINGNFVNKGNAMEPWGIAYDPSNGYLYVADTGSNTVSVINGATVIATIPVGFYPWGVAYDPSNRYIYVTNFGSETVSVIDGANNTVIANITVGSAPMGVAYDPSNGYIYVTNSASGTVSIISTSVLTSSTSISSVTTSTTSTSTSVLTSSTSISSVTTSTTSTSTKPTPSVVPTLVVVAVVVVVVLIVALLMIKHRKT